MSVVVPTRNPHSVTTLDVAVKVQASSKKHHLSKQIKMASSLNLVLQLMKMVSQSTSQCFARCLLHALSLLQNVLDDVACITLGPVANML